jgi:ATP-dependent Clp protease ATP-binding subunit ClpC
VEKQLQQNLEDSRKKWEEDQKNSRKIVDEDNVADVVSMMTGIPMKKVSLKENEKLSSLTSIITSNVIGQDDAVQKVVKSIQRGRVGLKDPNRPIGSFLFLGPTGVGKCVTKDTLITLRNKNTGEIYTCTIFDLLQQIS